MAQNVTLYNLLISCPGDVKDELAIIESAVEEFNDLYAEPLGITIKTRHWGKSSYAQSGGKPQALLNEQLVNKCDAAVAIMWTKFGSPTDDYGSGTEEEIEIMLQSGKQVFMYFSDKPFPPSKMNEDGYKQVQAFREKYKDRGIYFTYSSDEEFKKLFFAHLSMYFLSQKKERESADARVSELKLMGIDAVGKLDDDASIYEFVLNSETTMEQYIDTIRSMYQEIAGIPVGKRSSYGNSLFAGFNTPVEIEQSEQKLLSAVAEQLKIDIPNNFFDLGNLFKDSFSSEIISGPHLTGSSDEKRKYWKIIELHKVIVKALSWGPIERAYDHKMCIRLAVQNCGKAVDEDVEISMTIPKDALLTPDEFPELTDDSVEYLVTSCDMDELFGIVGTAEYEEFSASQKSAPSYHSQRPNVLPGFRSNYRKDYIEELNDVFHYARYDNGANYTLKLKVDYIKHHTSVAFPTVLLLKGEVSEIPYSITSKNNPSIVEGVLNVRKTL